MAILQASEFANKFEIHTNGVNLLKLTSYIERYEESYIIDMLGVELGELFLERAKKYQKTPEQKNELVFIEKKLNKMEE